MHLLPLKSWPLLARSYCGAADIFHLQGQSHSYLFQDDFVHSRFWSLLSLIEMMCQRNIKQF